MDFNDPLQRQVFFEIHRDLPREAPGSRASTLRALDLAVDTSAAEGHLEVVDVGCGPGRQTLDLASRLAGAQILALDLHQAFLRDLGRRAARAGVAGRVSPVRADMQRLPVAPGAVDLVWCEGAAYVMGVGPALAAWRTLLRPGGACGFTEAVWLRENPPAPVRQFWADYPGMADVERCRTLVRAQGYDLLGDFVLPEADWWDGYFEPMAARIDRLEVHYRQDPAARAVLAECRNEIDIRRRYADWYGYAFFVARCRG